MSRIGIIAEDASDVDVVRSVINKIAKLNYGVDKFVGHGCGKLRTKSKPWSLNLRERGCKYLILVHDLDTENPNELKNKLGKAIDPCPIEFHIIVIPEKEIEAWLLADHQAIKKAMNVSVGRIKNPEGINRPKEHLRDLIFMKSGHRSRYFHTIHNKKIADACTLDNLRRCKSFRPLEEFLRTHLN
jgi:hypothetical protein